MALILFVDDDLGSRVLYEKACIILGHRALLADSGRLGIEIARTHLPDLILLDLSLPDFNGLQVLVKIREEPETAIIPVVIVSAGVTAEDPQLALASGAAAYLNKPVGLNDLQRVINQFTAPANPEL
jgi:CheY-like chemotaxis protein